MFPSNVDYIFVLPSKKVRFKLELSPNLCQLMPESDPKSLARLTTLDGVTEKKEFFAFFAKVTKEKFNLLYFRNGWS